MKQLILTLLLIALVIQYGRSSKPGATDTLVEVRTGDWPITIEKYIDRKGTSFALLYRNEEEMAAVVMDTIPFPDREQLQYFGKALTYLKTANNGDIAKFQGYSVKRADKKYEGVFYIVRDKWGSTDFRQPEADAMITAINKQ